MANLRKIYGCPVELSLELLGGKWKSVILVRFLDHIAQRDNVWVATRRDIARHWYRVHSALAATAPRIV
jgi:allantoinase